MYCFFIYIDSFELFHKLLWASLYSCVSNSLEWLEYTVGGIFSLLISVVKLGLPWWLSNAGWCRFDSWVGKIPWRRTWQPTPIFLMGNPMDGGAWQAKVHGVTKSRTWLSNYITTITAWPNCSPKKFFQFTFPQISIHFEQCSFTPYFTKMRQWLCCSVFLLPSLLHPPFCWLPFMADVDIYSLYNV